MKMRINPKKLSLQEKMSCVFILANMLVFLVTLLLFTGINSMFREIDMVYEDNMIMRKYSGYTSVNDGYSFILPEKWMDKVTVKIENNEIIFYKFEGDLNGLMPELLRISVVDDENTTDKIKNGYKIIKTKGDKKYLVFIPENQKEDLLISLSEVQFYFKFL